MAGATTSTQVGAPAGELERRRVARGWLRWPWQWRWRYTLPGAVFAVAFACLSLTPSLLPRNGLTQGLVCGISAAIGYGVGVVAAWIWRAFTDRAERPARRGSWQVFAGASVVAVLVSMGLGRHWQAQLRELMGLPPGPLSSLVVIPVVAAAIFVVLVGFARLLRRLYRRLAALFDRWIGHRAAVALGWVIVAAGTTMVVNGVIQDGLIAAADSSFSLSNGQTDDGAEQPTAAERSGSPQSLVSWESLGREGRNFTGRGPSATRIAQFTGDVALEPIRAYAGLESADTSQERARLAVADLTRAGGFQRSNLIVFTTTGSGWVDPAAVDSVEYLTDGDVATVTMQYSYLPSWLSYLVDQERAREAGRDLFDAVYERWSQLPPASRPRLLVAGESLGSFGAETAFSGEHDLHNRTDGALFVGPPNFNTLFREFVANRDPGTPEVAPVYEDGRTVRFTGNPAEPIPPVGLPWTGSRVLYVMHPSDPVVWWSPNLIVDRPDWLAEPASSDVLQAMRWVPFVTFWQVTADLPFAGEMPPGHGHVYSREYVDAWMQILQPAGWGEAQLERLRDRVTPAG